jgi:CRP-like cAMP-binding protein
MHEALRQYIERVSEGPLPEAEYEMVKVAFIPKKLRKRQYFLQEGEVNRYNAFIVKGAMRQYSVDSKGVEHILRFGVENWWMGDRESFTMLTPSKYNIDALEDCELLQVTYAAMQELIQQSPAMAKTVRIMDERSWIASQRRIHASISLTAEERYLELQASNPVFLQRFPQNMIASYLGISPETLSRVRKQALSK